MGVVVCKKAHKHYVNLKSRFSGKISFWKEGAGNKLSRRRQKLVEGSCLKCQLFPHMREKKSDVFWDTEKATPKRWKQWVTQVYGEKIGEKTWENMAKSQIKDWTTNSPSLIGKRNSRARISISLNRTLQPFFFLASAHPCFDSDWMSWGNYSPIKVT